MAVKRYFSADGVLTEIELPDRALPVPALAGDRSVHQLLNPTRVDPETLLVDAAQVPDLKPTVGAMPLTRFPERPPGTGEGAGSGQKSGLTLRDVWENNPDRNGVTQVETAQSGPIGSAVVDPLADADRRVGGSMESPKPGEDEAPDDTWTKAQLGEYITLNGGEAPADTELKAVFLEKATEVHATKSLS